MQVPSLLVGMSDCKTLPAVVGKLEGDQCTVAPTMKGVETSLCDFTQGLDRSQGAFSILITRAAYVDTCTRVQLPAIVVHGGLQHAHRIFLPVYEWAHAILRTYLRCRAVTEVLSPGVSQARAGGGGL
jgi:hypothetical protein